MSRAAIETLSIIAYQQPITRSEIENIRGVQMGRGSIDHLMEIGWIKPSGRTPYFSEYKSCTLHQDFGNREKYS